MKYFTYASLTQSYRYNNQNRIALVFGTDDGQSPSEEEILEIVKDPLVTQMFGDVLFAYAVEMYGNADAVAITPHDTEIPRPGEAKLDTPPVLVYIKGEPHQYDLRKRFADCRTLLKALGCENCPDHGDVCRARSLPIAGLRTEFPTDSDEEKLKHKVTQIAGFTYVSPVVTKPQGEHFMQTLRKYDQHDFSQVEAWSKVRSEASTTAAASRNFKRKQCRNCLLYQTCDHYKSCEGRYPTEGQITRKLISEWTPRMRDLFKKVAPWKVWTVARSAGREGITNRRQVVLSGVSWVYESFPKSGYSLKFEVYRKKTSIDSELRTLDYDLLVKIFGLPATFEEAIERRIKPMRPESDLAYALWLRSLEMHHGPSRAWGGRNDIVIRQLDDHGVELTMTNGYCIFGWSKNLYSYKDVFGQGADLGVPKLKYER